MNQPRREPDAVTEIARNTRAVHLLPLVGRGDPETPELTGIRCWLRLANGWTVSISEDDTPPALCCLAAWRTGQDDLPYEDLTLFDFGDGRTDCRCWTFTDVREALIKVAAAGAPPA